MDGGLLKYRTFVTTVELGSFTKAAQRLDYSQSAVSRMIADLEADWGVTLLERGKSGVSLTSDGLRLLPYAQSVVNEEERLRMQVSALTDLQTGLIRIGTFSSVATHRLPKIIKRFQADYPGIDYELLLGDYTEIESWILNGRVDCGFLPLPTHSALQTRFLEEDRLLAVLPEGHPLADCARFPVEALSDEPFMLLEKGGRAEVSDLLGKYGITPRVHFTTWDDYAIMSMVESGLGIAILPELILQRNPYRIVTKELSVPATRRIGVAMRKGGVPSLAVERFLTYLEER